MAVFRVLFMAVYLENVLSLEKFRWSGSEIRVQHDPHVGLVQHSSLFLHCPITRKGTMIESQLRGGSIDSTLIQYCTTGRRKVLGALIADIVFRRLQAAPIGGGFRATGIDRNQFMTDAADSGLGQQLLNDPFRLLVFALAEMMLANAPLRIDEIEGRPIFVLESTPYRMVAIDRDRIIDLHVLRRSANVIDVFLECELRTV